MRSYEQYNQFFRLLGFGLLTIRRKFRVKYRYFSNKSNKSKCSARCIGFFWKGSRILKTIRNSEELREGAIEHLEKARARLRKVETEADRFRANGYSEIEREKLNLINSIYTTLEQFENYKNDTIRFEQLRHKSHKFVKNGKIISPSLHLLS
ncbi:hypothetical protein Lal_00003651 [Lupinus albus]|nr:hypothetical protein Lal_00003651 [Lupinus albus]